MQVDKTGDGFLGASYYNRGHIKFKRSYLGWAVSFVAAAGLILIVGVLLAASFNLKPAQELVNILVAGK